jgi:DNA gyrase subunit B
MGFISDCASKDAPACELFIVQSGYAALAKEMRDRVYQAVLSVDSTIVMIKGANLYSMLDDDEVKSIIAALGVGIVVQRSHQHFKLENLRYGKVIIVTDPSAEGMHILAQVVSLLYKSMYPVMAAGHVYVVPSENWVAKEFHAKVMAPTTRRLIQLRRATSIKEALVNLPQVHI